MQGSETFLHTAITDVHVRVPLFYEGFTGLVYTDLCTCLCMTIDISNVKELCRV